MPHIFGDGQLSEGDWPASAEDFLRSPHLNDTSCVISDVQMPDIGGIELQSMLIAQGKNLPVIFITAFPDERIRAQVIKAGAVCILSKPFEGSTLIRCIDNALKTRTVKG